MDTTAVTATAPCGTDAPADGRVGVGGQRLSGFAAGRSWPFMLYFFASRAWLIRQGQGIGLYG